MKNTIALSVFLLAASVIAATISGDFNTWHGYMSGFNANGGRNTLVGAGAGGEANGIDSCVFIGAGAGTYTTNCTDCVFIGFGSGRGMEDMTHATDINGQIRMSEDSYGGFWIEIGSSRNEGGDTIFESGGGETTIRANYGVNIAAPSVVIDYGSPTAEDGLAGITAPFVAELHTNIYTRTAINAAFAEAIKVASTNNNLITVLSAATNALHRASAFVQ